VIFPRGSSALTSDGMLRQGGGCGHERDCLVDMHKHQRTRLYGYHSWSKHVSDLVGVYNPLYKTGDECLQGQMFHSKDEDR
jgi:hypothetical protein